jgi:hypothetical protein
MPRFYILYPKRKDGTVKVTKTRPSPRTARKKYAFAEGGFNKSSAVVRRLNQMNIPVKQRPKLFKSRDWK